MQAPTLREFHLKSSYSINMTVNANSACLSTSTGMRMQTMSLWAYATLEARVGRACLAGLAAEAQRQLPRMDAQHVINMLWAFAKLGYNPGAALLRACDAHATRAPSSFSGHGLVRCCSRAAAPRVWV